MGILPDKCLSHTDKMPISSHDGFGRASSRSRVRFDSSFIHFLAYQFGSGSVPSLDEYIPAISNKFFVQYAIVNHFRWSLYDLLHCSFMKARRCIDGRIIIMLSFVVVSCYCSWFSCSSCSSHSSCSSYCSAYVTNSPRIQCLTVRMTVSLSHSLSLSLSLSLSVSLSHCKNAREGMCGSSPQSDT